MLETVNNVILKKNIFSPSLNKSYKDNHSDIFSNTLCDVLTKNLLSKEIEFSNVSTKKKIKTLYQNIF